MDSYVNGILDEIKKWGAISTGVSGGFSVVIMLIVIILVVQLRKLQKSVEDLKSSMRSLDSDLKNVGMMTMKRSDELTASFQRVESSMIASQQQLQSQLSSISPRSDYNDELLNRTGLLPTRAVGPPVPPKRANSYYKSSYY